MGLNPTDELAELWFQLLPHTKAGAVPLLEHALGLNPQAADVRKNRETARRMLAPKP